LGCPKRIELWVRNARPPEGLGGARIERSDVGAAPLAMLQHHGGKRINPACCLLEMCYALGQSSARVAICYDAKVLLHGTRSALYLFNRKRRQER